MKVQWKKFRRKSWSVFARNIESLKPVDLNDAVNQLKMSTEHVLHEQVTGDDAPHKYAQILSDLQTLNQELAKIRALPERIDL